jgi:hypothetical protein
MEAVYFIFIVFLLIYSAFVEFNVFFVNLFLQFVHLVIQLTQHFVGYRLQPFFRFSRLLRSLRMLTVVRVS